ncbi:hypothetical protein BC343_13845 [Mucilaginibacter pedocola]|uniref:Uncharacterized protein n=1 Tax=Mucilaginibacter pedocola TaxID=1792845 RepID=A0A1S9PA86_9SPHI|nr:hypothetical protein BC343_13845 [Mucilaginibacter pedocola]
MKPALNGVRGYIAIHFDRIYKRLPLSEKLMVSNVSNNKHHFLIYNEREPERLLQSIADGAALFCKNMYDDKGMLEQLFNDRKDAIIFSLPYLSGENSSVWRWQTGYWNIIYCLTEFISTILTCITRYSTA